MMTIKKLIALVIVISMIAACNSSSNNQTTKDSSTTMSATDTSMDSMSRSMSPLADGTVGMREGKMMIAKSGGWKVMDEPVTCSDGCRVMPSGQIIMKNGEKMMLKEGETVDKDGHVMDANGKMMMDEKMPMNDSTK
jgi:hypothetical protein